MISAKKRAGFNDSLTVMLANDPPGIILFILFHMGAHVELRLLFFIYQHDISLCLLNSTTTLQRRDVEMFLHPDTDATQADKLEMDLFTIVCRQPVHHCDMAWFTAEVCA